MGCYPQVLHHSTFCSRKLATFQGREDILNNIKQALLTSWQDPEVVTDDSGDKDDKRPGSTVGEEGQIEEMVPDDDSDENPAGPDDQMQFSLQVGA